MTYSYKTVFRLISLGEKTMARFGYIIKDFVTEKGAPSGQ